jgi:hypothetical protein
MLTIFSIPKPFREEFAVIQRNAIQSWRLLHSDCEVILFGTEEGTAEIAAELNMRHVPEVARNEYGTPLVNDIFDQAQNLARHSVLCYVNADIILMGNFLAALHRIMDRPRFLMIGQRRDVDIQEPWDFADPNWETNLRNHAKSEGECHQPFGVDYFAFSRGLYQDIPPFAIGRYYWDHWLVYSALASGVPVFDATPATVVIHQNHGYSSRQVMSSPESARNLELAHACTVGGEFLMFPAQSATWIIGHNGVRPALTLVHLWRRFLIALLLHPSLHGVFLLLKRFRKRQLAMSSRLAP